MNDKDEADGDAEATQYTAETGLRSRAVEDDSSPVSYPSLFYTGLPDTTHLEEAGDCDSHVDPMTLEAQEQVLVTVPGAIVHLIDEENSVHLGSGDLQLIRLSQQGNGIAVFAKVGDDLQWPLFKDEATVKLDPTHYFFSLKVPAGSFVEEEDGAEPPASGQDDDPGLETLNYGVTLCEGGVESRLKELDVLLARYSLFSSPTVVEKEQSGEVPDSAKVVKVEEVSGHRQLLTEPNSAAYWTSLAPDVTEYNSSLARAIAQGSGHIIRVLFWVSDATVWHLEKGGAYMSEQSWAKARNKGPVKLSPRARKNMKRVKSLSKMSAKVTKCVLIGVVRTTGIFAAAVVNSKAGNKFFKLLPGEVALVSLDGFGKVVDALEHCGKAVLGTSSSVATGLVAQRYGPEAAEFAEDGLKTTGNVILTAWTITKLRKALNPKEFLKSKTGIAKSVFKAAAAIHQKAP